MDGPAPAGFERIDTWVFDLDNTLYSPRCDLFAQVDRRMGAFIAERLKLTLEEARRVQKRYYREHGTTLRGLMREHGVEPQAFLDYVHDIDHSPVEPDSSLAAAIAALKGRKYILTNGTRRHAEKVAARLGVLDLFDDVFDIAAGGYVPKPDHEIYDRFVRRFELAAGRAAMFEDIPRNLEAPHALGMTTVLVVSDGHPHPDEKEGLTEAPPDAPHIHHVTDNLAEFLRRAGAVRT